MQFFKTFVVILDDNEQGTPWHFVRDNKSSAIRKPLIERTFCAQYTSASVERVFNKLVRLIADTVCGAANVNKTKDTTHPQG